MLRLAIGIGIAIGTALSLLFGQPPVPDPAPSAYPAPVVSYPAPGYPAPAPVLPTATPYAMQTPTSAPTWTAEPPPVCPPETPGCEVTP